MYCIKLGNNYITSKGKNTKNIEFAKKLDTLKEASLFLAQKVNPSSIAHCEIIDVDKNTVVRENPKSSYMDNVDVDKIISTAKSIVELSSNIDRMKHEVEDAYQDVELEVCDVYHYIELNDLNAADGYKAYKMLQEALKRRRKIKDTANIISNFTSILESENIENLYHIFENLDDRDYRPRSKKDLFKK